MSPRVLIGSLALVSLIATASARPNIILLLLDDHSTVDEGLEVMPEYRRRFADEGMKMSNAFVASPKCCPSRTSLLSGRFAHNLNDATDGWCGDFMAQARYNDTFMRQVSAEGYRVGMQGKYINAMQPLCPKKGDTASRGIVPAGFDIAAGDSWVAMCNEAYYNVTWCVNGDIVPTGDAPSDYAQAFLGNATIPWLQRVAKAAGSGGAPFFAFLAPHAPHLPAQPAPWHYDRPLPPSAQRAPRTPSYNANKEGKSWNVAEDARIGFTAATIAGIDTHAQNRARTLMSVDDYVRDIFAVLEATGTLDNTYVIATNHLGNFGLPFEKSTMYDTDVRVPFYVRGPGVRGNCSALGLVSLMDVGATILELTGATAPGARTTDGRSFVPLLRAGGGVPPPGWRDGVLIEHISELNQWMNVCLTIWNVSGCPLSPVVDPFFLIDGPQNTWASWRVINTTSNFAFGAFRPQGSDPTRANSNWTELYDLAADPWQGANLALNAAIPLGAYESGLWAIADCALESCP